MENIFKLSKNTISLVVIVISTVGFDGNEAHIFDQYCKKSKLEFLKNWFPW